MARYIEESEAIMALSDYYHHRTQGQHDALREAFSRVPTADAVSKERYDRLLENAIIMSEALRKYQSDDMVEVVRCKDCRHWMDIDDGQQKHFMCSQIGCGEWFCADGERKETEDGDD